MRCVCVGVGECGCQGAGGWVCNHNNELESVNEWMEEGIHIQGKAESKDERQRSNIHIKVHI